MISSSRELRPLWTQARVYSGRQTKVGDGRYPLYGANGVIGRTDAEQDGSVVLVGRVGSVGAVVQPSGRFGASDNALVCRVDTRHLDARWLAYWLSVVDWSPHLAGTAQPLLTGRLLGEQRLPPINLHRQRRISNYLDTETARMDVLIQKAEAAVGLLMERERAQLDGHFTEDGIGSDRWGWSAPADWQRVPMSSLTTTLFADGDWIESPDITDSGVRLIQTGNIGVGEYREQGYRYIAPETFSKLACTEVLPGDVLLCRLAAPIGRACLAPDLAMRMVTSVDVTILRCRPDVVPEFVVAACSTSGWLQRLDAEGQGGTRSRIARLRLGEMRIPLPGVAQQRHVLEVIARAREETSDAVAALMRQAALLRERRQALITAAVTGELEG